jgi:hypothetical protein
MASKSEAVKVFVRVRPMNSMEKARGCHSVLKVDRPTNQIEMGRPDSGEPAKCFAFDAVYDVDS